MKVIKMIKGMTVINGVVYSTNNGAFNVDDEAKAARLVELGVAVYADGSKVVKADKVSEKGNDEKDVDSMSYEELKAKAAELGIKYPGKKKAELIAEIKSAIDGEEESDIEDDVEMDAPKFSPEGNIQ